MNSAPDKEWEPGKKVVLIVYILLAIGVFVGATFIAAVVVDYIKRDEAKGTWLESHFRWQIRTFWYGILWGAIGMITLLIGVGFIILAADYIWIIYRIVKGMIYLNDGREMYR